MLKKTTFIYLLFFATISFTLHKYYVSTSDFVYKSDVESLQITIRLFADDYLQTLSKLYDEEIDLDTDLNSAELLSYTRDYVSKNLDIYVDDKKILPVCLGFKSTESDIIFMFLEAEGTPSFTKIGISNRLLFNSFQNQQNIVRFKSSNIQKSFLQSRQSFFDELIITNQ